MINLPIRIVSVFLIGSLVADPVTASAFSATSLPGTLEREATRCLVSPYQTEALTLMLRASAYRGRAQRGQFSRTLQRLKEFVPSGQTIGGMFHGTDDTLLQAEELVRSYLRYEVGRLKAYEAMLEALAQAARDRQTIGGELQPSFDPLIRAINVIELDIDQISRTLALTRAQMIIDWRRHREWTEFRPLLLAAKISAEDETALTAILSGDPAGMDTEQLHERLRLVRGKWVELAAAFDRIFRADLRSEQVLPKIPKTPLAAALPVGWVSYFSVFATIFAGLFPDSYLIGFGLFAIFYAVIYVAVTWGLHLRSLRRTRSAAPKKPKLRSILPPLFLAGAGILSQLFVLPEHTSTAMAMAQGSWRIVIAAYLGVSAAAVAAQISRRVFMQRVGGLGGMFGASLKAQQREIPQIPAISDPKDEEVRSDILTIFGKPEIREDIDRMFDEGLIRPEAKLSREEVHEAMAAFVEFIRQARIVPEDDPRFAERIDLRGNEFHYPRAGWTAMKSVGLAKLFHAAIHLSVRQKAMRRVFDATREDIVKRYPKLDKASVMTDSYLRAAIQTVVGSLWWGETQATYAEMAFLAAQARAQSLEDYLLELAAPLAEAAGLTAKDYMDRAVKQGIEAAPEAVILAHYRRYAGYTEPRALEYDTFVVNILQERILFLFAYLLANESLVEYQMLEQQKNPDEILLEDSPDLASWARDTFPPPALPTAPDRTAPPELTKDGNGSYWTYVSLAVAGGGALAYWRWKRLSGKSPRILILAIGASLAAATSVFGAASPLHHVDAEGYSLLARLLTVAGVWALALGLNDKMKRGAVEYPAFGAEGKEQLKTLLWRDRKAITPFLNRYPDTPPKFTLQQLALKLSLTTGATRKGITRLNNLGMIQESSDKFVTDDQAGSPETQFELTPEFIQLLGMHDGLAKRLALPTFNKVESDTPEKASQVEEEPAATEVFAKPPKPPKPPSGPPPETIQALRTLLEVLARHERNLKKVLFAIGRDAFLKMGHDVWIRGSNPEADPKTSKPVLSRAATFAAEKEKITPLKGLTKDLKRRIANRLETLQEHYSEAAGLVESASKADDPEDPPAAKLFQKLANIHTRVDELIKILAKVLKPFGAGEDLAVDVLQETGAPAEGPPDPEKGSAPSRKISKPIPPDTAHEIKPVRPASSRRLSRAA